MIKEVTMYTVICDNCGKSSGDDAEYSCWNDAGYARENAHESDWIEDDTREKDYCPDCCSYDDDDNLILKQVEAKP